MKFELVMLATVFSTITERQVEAQLLCYENRNFTGLNGKIQKSIQNLTSLFPNGARACNITAKSVLIFYSEPKYRGDIIAVNGDDTKVVPRFGFTVRSVLVLPNPTIDEGLLLFKEEKFQGGVFQSFNPKTVNVQGNITFGSAVVLGDTLDWTAVRRCRLVDQNGQCLVCLRRAKSRASFIKSIKSTGMWETEAIFPGACAGTNYTGESSIQGDDLKCYECDTTSGTAKNCKIHTVDHVGRKCKVCMLLDGRSLSVYCSGEQKSSAGPNVYWYSGRYLRCSCNYNLCNVDAATCKSRGRDFNGK